MTQAQALVNAQVQRFSVPSAADNKSSISSDPAGPGLASAVSSAGAGGQNTLPNASGNVNIDSDDAGKVSSSEYAGKHDYSSSTNSRNRNSQSDSQDKDAAVGSKDKEKETPALFRFFQSADGQKAFLHPLDMRQLLDDAELGRPLPERLDAEVQ